MEKGDRKDNMAKKIEVNIPATTGEIQTPIELTRHLSQVDAYMIGKALASMVDEIKDNIPAGKLEGIVDKIIHIQFGYKKSEDVEKMVVQTAKPWRLLMAAMNRLNGVSIEAIVEDAERLAEAEEGKAKKQVELALEKIKGKTLKLTKGQVRVAGLTVKEVVS